MRTRPDEPPDRRRPLRSALGRFTTGVTIISCVDAAGVRVGLTANSFKSLSLDPPLVLWSLRAASPSVEAFVAAKHFAVNVLAEAQVELSRRFASRRDDKFAEGAWAPGSTARRCSPAARRSSSARPCRSRRRVTTCCSSAAWWPQRGGAAAAGVPVRALPPAGGDPVRKAL